VTWTVASLTAGLKQIFNRSFRTINENPKLSQRFLQANKPRETYPSDIASTFKRRIRTMFSTDIEPIRRNDDGSIRLNGYLRRGRAAQSRQTRRMLAALCRLTAGLLSGASRRPKMEGRQMTMVIAPR
jgi:hypothetical protein